MESTQEKKDTIRYDMKNTKTEEEKKRLQKDWEAIDERQRYSPISTPGTYWDLKTGRPFTVKEERNFFEPVLVTATRAHGETIFESAMSSAINAKIAKYLGRETVIGDALTLPWDIAKDANIDKYGIQGARDRVLVNIYGTIGLSWLTLKTRGYIGAIIGGSGAVFLNEYKEVIAPLLNDGERKKSDEQYVEDLKDEMD